MEPDRTDLTRLGDRAVRRCCAVALAAAALAPVPLAGGRGPLQAAIAVVLASVGVVAAGIAALALFGRGGPLLVVLGSPLEPHLERLRRGRAEARRVLGMQWRVMRMLGAYRGALARGLGLTVLISVVAAAQPWPTKVLVDSVLGDHPFFGLGQSGALAVVVLGSLLLFAAAGGLSLLHTKVLFGLSQRLIRDLRARVFTHLMQLSLRFHDERSAGDSIYRVTTDTYAVQNVLIDGINPLLSSVMTLTLTVAVMLRLDVGLTVLALLSLPVAAAVTRRFGRRIRDSSLALHQRESDVYAHAEQSITAVRAVQAFAREEHEARRFGERADASRDAMLRLVTTQTVFGLAIDLILAVGLALVTYVAARQAIAGRLTAGEVLVFLAYAGALYQPITGITTLIGEVQSATAGAQRVFEVLDEPVPDANADTPPPRRRAHGELCLDGVTFAYSGGTEVLHGVSVTVRPGELVALVGPTGAGKSTMASLALRLYDPTAGQVRLDGDDLRLLPLSWLREQIAYVPQEPLLFPVSVRENIRYGRLDADDEAIEDAARRAGILDELTADPRGLDAPLGDRGITLSGGQRQRVALARAFLKDAPVVVLDEPTSALDSVTEVQVMEAIDRLAAGRSVFVIAHRLGTVQRADRVVVLEDGCIVQEGPHRELVTQPGLYRLMHAARFGDAEKTDAPRRAPGLTVITGEVDAAPQQERGVEGA